MLGKAGDRVANAFIIEALKQQRPDGIRSEEEKDNPERPLAGRVWIADPLHASRADGRPLVYNNAAPSCRIG